MLRIHFTTGDLIRTRFTATAGPLAETFNSLYQPHRADRAHGGGHGPGAGGADRWDPDLPFRPWRRRLAARVDEASRPLWTLTGPGPWLDLAALAGTDPSVEVGLQTLLGAPDALVRSELEHVTMPHADRAWLAGLTGGDLAARRLLADSLHAAYRDRIGPYWDRMRAHLDGVRADWARTLVDHGIERLLETLCPGMVRWRAPVLEVRFPRELDHRPAGRGLVITPMVFLPGGPELLFDPADETVPATLLVPTVRDPLVGAGLWEEPGRGGEPPLAALLGRTRAAALGVVAQGCSTTELARRLAVSPASASQHTTVLRNANLITTRRRGGAVLHTLTPLGAELLHRGSAAH
ncbi:winged helix-turn-helix domain-containing protein [Kitasatospora sp. NPDC048540]|uniref:winged helix-turn-helix domain-containing protein n=1 Tax=unclassified Kitasatospora TaxID=2633591 RepID=UPI00053B9539|nr:winged helix-turn-helix domain-containing protein [Kitasatospora sp. MBT63]